MKYYYFVSYNFKDKESNADGFGNLRFDCNFKIMKNEHFKEVNKSILDDLMSSKEVVGIIKNPSIVILNIVLLGEECEDGE